MLVCFFNVSINSKLILLKVLFLMVYAVITKQTDYIVSSSYISPTGCQKTRVLQNVT